MSKPPRRILVADSDYAFAQGLRAELEADGCAVEIVSDGLSAINLVKTRPFNGAIVDTDLATVDGLHAVALIKDLKRALPVVVTGKRDRAEAEPTARGAGAGAYLAKPCEPAQVVEALQQCMSGDARAAPRTRPSVTLARLEPGQVLLLECPGRQVEGRLSSRLLAKHPASLAVAAPRREGEPVSLPFGVPVTVGFPMPDGWYYFDTYVLGAVSHSGEPAILLAQPKLVSHVQRRRYVRARSSFSVQLGTEPGAVAAKGQDAGEGGIRVLTERPVAVGSHISCRIAAGGAQPEISLPGTVVWTQELRDNGHRYRLGIEFSLTSGAERKQVRAWLEGLAHSAENAGASPHAVDGVGASPPN